MNRGMGGRAAARRVAVACAIAVGWASGATATASALPVVSVSDAPPTIEATGSTVNATFTVTLSEVPSSDVTVDYQTVSDNYPDSATRGVDYTPIPAGLADELPHLTFTADSADDLTQQVTVAITGDALDEYTEYFRLVLSNPVGSGTSIDPLHAYGLGTITDDDPPPSVSVADVGVTEGTGGNRLMTFKATLSAPTGKTVKVDWATADGTATSGGLTPDYTAATGTVTFLPTTADPQVTADINVVIVGDATDETDETVGLTLSNARNVPLPPLVEDPDAAPALADPTATGTIDDDDGPSINISDSSVNEGGPGGTAQAALVVTLSQVSVQDVKVMYATADDTATAPGDYDAVSPAVLLTIPAGQVTGTINVTVRGDALDEGDEQFRVNLTAPVDGVIGDPAGVVTIKDDDASPAVSLPDVSVTEGSSGTPAAKLTLSLAAPSARLLQFKYTTQDGTAIAGQDYTAAATTVSVPAGSTTVSFSIPITPDTTVEEDETFKVLLTRVTGTGPDIAPATVTILDDDLSTGDTPALAVSDATVREGQDGTTQAVFTVSVAQALARSATAHFATADGTATAPADYQAVSGRVTVPAGATSAQIVVPVVGDRLPEGNQTFKLVLSDPVSATLGDAEGIGVIVDDDAGLLSAGISPTTVAPRAFLCRRGVACAGLLQRWRTLLPGTIQVTVSAQLPARTAGKRKIAARRVVLVTQRFAVARAGAGSGRVRLRDTRAAGRLLTRLRTAKVRTADVTVTFVNRVGAGQSITQKVTLKG